MALSAQYGVRLSQTSPAFLHANSTSHTWIFSAIAELVDNAYDPDVNAANMWIDRRMVKDKPCLMLTDDGRGCAPDKLHKMLSFGYCAKIDIKGHKPIGQYGNGFKSGSMRLGKDAMVLTKHGKTMSVGFLSQTYLEAIGAETVLVPIATWTKKGFQLVEAPDAEGSVDAILKYSLFHTEDDLLAEFQGIRSGTGTRILIYNLNRGSDGHLELDFESDRLDIINSEHQELDFAGGLMSRPVREHMTEYRRSLREYLSILFLKPRMKISLRSCRVKTKLIRKSLRKTRKTTYTPSWMLSTGRKGVEIIFGFGPSKQDYGVMMYHRNRLIKAYEHVGLQKQANEMGVGVVGVVELDFLEAIHNKQDFSKTDRYNACISALGIKLNQYWNAITGNADSASEFLRRPDWTWVQCEQCLKWRRLPDEMLDTELPEKWYCYMNPDMSHNRCDINEEPEHEDEVFRLVVNKNTKKTKKKEDMPAIPQMINNSFMPSNERVVQCGLAVPMQPMVVQPRSIGGLQVRQPPRQPKTEDTPTPPRAAGRGKGPIRQIRGVPVPGPSLSPPPSPPAQQIKAEEFISTAIAIDQPEGDQSGSHGGLKVALFSKRAKKRDVVELDDDGEKSSKPKKQKYTETTTTDGETVLMLPSSDEEDSDDEVPLVTADVKLEKEGDTTVPSISVSETEGRTLVSFTETSQNTPEATASNATANSGMGKISNVTSVEPDTSSTSDKEPGVKTEREKDLSRRLGDTMDRLGDTNRKLGSLRRNIRTLLKILVPNFQLEDPEMVDRVVIEMINVNADGKGPRPDTGLSTSVVRTEPPVVVEDDSIPTSSVDDSQTDNNTENNPTPTEEPTTTPTEEPTTTPTEEPTTKEEDQDKEIAKDKDQQEEVTKDKDQQEEIITKKTIKIEKDLPATWTTKEGIDDMCVIDLDDYEVDEATFNSAQDTVELSD